MASNEYKLTVVDGTELTLSLNAGLQGPAGPAGPAGPNEITTSTDTPLVGYIYGNGTNVAGSTTASTTASPNTLALRDASGKLAASDLEIYVKAATTIPKGAVVYISGASGNNKLISLAQANTEALSSKTIGVAIQALATNASGYVITEGDITGLGISLGSGHGVVEGDPIWLSPTTAGGMVFKLANKPSAPNHMVFVGYVTKLNGNTLDSIYVKIQNGFELQELHNVQISSPSNNQVLTYDSADGLWKNAAFQSGDALPLAGGAMDTGATITLDTAPSENGTYLESAVSGGEFLVRQINGGSGAPDHNARITPYNITLYRTTDSNLISLTSNPSTITVSSQYSTPDLRTVTLSGGSLAFDNGSKLQKGTTDAGIGGNGGIALKCSVDYELKWDAGRLYTMEQDGFTIRRVDRCGTTAPTSTDGVADGFAAGSIWTLDDGTSYICTNAGVNNDAVWVSHIPFVNGDGLAFNTGTNTLSCSSNVARRAGNQTFTGNNNFGTNTTGVTTTFYGQVALNNQSLTNDNSAVTRGLGDTRYLPAFHELTISSVTANSVTLVTIAQLTLEGGTYYLEAYAATYTPTGTPANTTIRLSSTVTGAAAFDGSDDYGNTPLTHIDVESDPLATAFIRQSVGTANTFSRRLTGIVTITDPTTLKLEFRQSATSANVITCRSGAFMIARQLAPLSISAP